MQVLKFLKYIGVRCTCSRKLGPHPFARIQYITATSVARKMGLKSGRTKEVRKAPEARL